MIGRESELISGYLPSYSALASMAGATKSRPELFLCVHNLHLDSACG